MPKTTKGDGMDRMERMAERWLRDQAIEEQYVQKTKPYLTRLLRKVARDARKQALDEVEALDPLMADCCGEWEQADDIAFGVQEWLVKTVSGSRLA